MRACSFTAAVVVCLVGTFGVAFAKDAASEGRRLSGPEILARFSDADMYGTFAAKGPDWAERTTADGRVLDLNQQAKLVGSWAVGNDEACYIYHGAPSQIVCYVMRDSNGALFFYESETGRLVAQTTKIVAPKH